MTKVVQHPAGALFGETLRSCRIGAFRMSERIYPPKLRTPKHSHKWPFLCLLMEGAFTVNRSDASIPCAPPMLIYHSPGEIHSECFHEAGARMFIVEMEPRWFKRIGQPAGNPLGFSSGMVLALATKLHREFHAGSDSSPLVIEGLVLEILGEAARHPAGPISSGAPLWLQKARELLQLRFSEPLRLEYIAKTVGVHPVHLAQMFRKHYRCTVGDHLRRLRIEFACRELANSDSPLVDIALAAGFCDQSHFTKTFRRHTGQVPSQFRDTLRTKMVAADQNASKP